MREKGAELVQISCAKLEVDPEDRTKPRVPTPEPLPRSQEMASALRDSLGVTTGN